MLSILLRVKFRLCRQYSAKPKKYAGRGDKMHRTAMAFRPIFISAVAEALGKAIPRPENGAEIVERHSGPALAESGGHQQGATGSLINSPQRFRTGRAAPVRLATSAVYRICGRIQPARADGLPFSFRSGRNGPRCPLRSLVKHLPRKDANDALLLGVFSH